ncbi:MAG TPA: hypothetical protein PLY95_02490 [Candidatus Paceibacterota bacterium]|nr:hypothetical protein [Candidatus Paceibacterota bacterium]HQJ83984.1 hypothetical protein [Candidatus Paceibacterota bacterium]
MSQESFDPSKLFTVPPSEFASKYRVLTNEELAELGESRIVPTVPEELKTSHEAFLQETFELWDSDPASRAKTASRAKITTEVRPPVDQNWSGLETDIDTDKFGELIINPETQNLNFETAKVFIPNLSDFEGKKLSEVAEHLVAEYGDKYYLPGLEYMEWVVGKNDLDSLPAGPEFEALKSELNDHVCFLFGSTLRRSSGHWCVPSVGWGGSAWHRRAYWLGSDWCSYGRVVLLER